ncbi:MAG TPA: SPOR domain-containing protein, partial [Acidobacteriaceae bacterium]|nr:SPOR domain-containing protein [Acidobacteriaceae bacterium]
QASESQATSTPSAMQPLHPSAAAMPANNAASQKPVASTQQSRPVHPLTRSSASTKALVVPAKAPAKTPASPSGSNSAYMVQVAAVASRKDAQVLASALQKHGLNAEVRSGTHDKFFHVLIGPFDTQQKAETMRHKVIASGYKAYLKPAS